MTSDPHPRQRESEEQSSAVVPDYHAAPHPTADDPPVPVEPILPEEESSSTSSVGSLTYFVPSNSRLVTIRNMPLFEAELAFAKLQSEDIPCVILDQEIARSQPSLFPSVKLQVHETNVALAEKVLIRPSESEMEGEYADEDWRCPKCHQRSVELVPLTPGQRALRYTFVVTLFLPVILALVQWVVPHDLVIRAINSAENYGFAWVGLAVFFGVAIVLSKRSKYCTSCEHRWSHGEAAPAEAKETSNERA